MIPFAALASRRHGSQIPRVPILASSYRAPSWLPGGHLQTIYPALFPKAPRMDIRRERIELPDGDFLDLDWVESGNPRLAIVSHGLEASSAAPYIRNVARSLHDNGWDVLAWNFRGCGGEANRLASFYHSGASEDLHHVITHAMERHHAEGIDLIGFSLGGNLTLKYLGERETPSRLNRAVAFSVPCDLACSSRELARWSNRVYMERFLISLRAKIRGKHLRFPDQIRLELLKGVRDFRGFDDRFTAPLHGFRDAEDYWARSSSRPFLSGIRIPTLLVNAVNDPFLGPACYPRREAEESDFLYLEMPEEGGHVGFPAGNNTCWCGERAAEFLAGA